MDSDVSPYVMCLMTNSRWWLYSSIADWWQKLTGHRWFVTRNYVSHSNSRLSAFTHAHDTVHCIVNIWNSTITYTRRVCNLTSYVDHSQTGLECVSERPVWTSEAETDQYRPLIVFTSSTSACVCCRRFPGTEPLLLGTPASSLHIIIIHINLYI